MGTKKKGSLISRIRAAASDLALRKGLSGQAGLSFSGERDFYEALGYTKDLGVENYRDRFQRGGIAARIVEAFPKATFRGGFEIVEDEDPETLTAFEEMWIELEKRLKITTHMLRTDILAGIGTYGVLLIGAPGEFNSELGSGSPEDIAYLQPFAEDDALIESSVTDPEDPRFGQPLEYKIKRLPGSGIVHWSRIIHVADGILDEVQFGEPRLRRVWNRLDDLEKCVGGGSEAFWQRAHQGYQVNIDPEVEMDESDMTDLEEEIDEYVHKLRRFVRLRGAELNALGSDVATFSTEASAIVDQIAAATGIPKRILMGSERGELASTQDRSNWNERVEDRRESYATPMIIEPFVNRLMLFGVLPEVEYEVRWASIQNLDEEQKSKVALTLDKVSEDVITKAEIRDRVLGLPRLEEVEDESDTDDEPVDTNTDAGTDSADGDEEEPIAAAQEKKSSLLLMSRNLMSPLGFTCTKPLIGKDQLFKRKRKLALKKRSVSIH